MAMLVYRSVVSERVTRCLEYDFLGTNMLYLTMHYLGFILRMYLANLNTPLNSTPFPLPIKHVYNI